MSDDDFRAALANAIDRGGWTQQRLGEALGLTAKVQQSKVSDWLRGVLKPPDPPVVCQMERILGLVPGTLTLHLGYLPPDVPRQVVTVEEALRNDPLLTPDHRDVMLVAYAASVEASAKAGRP